MTYFVKLNGNYVVVGVSMAAPMKTLNGEICVDSQTPVAIGQIYDPVAKSFAFAPAPPATTASLVAYAAKVQSKLSDGGIVITLDSGKTVSAATDVVGRLDADGLNDLAKQDPNFTTVWIQSSGDITLNAAQINSIALAVGKWREATFGAFATVKAAIVAGTITSEAEIDASSYWPAQAQ